MTTPAIAAASMAPSASGKADAGIDADIGVDIDTGRGIGAGSGIRSGPAAGKGARTTATMIDDDGATPAATIINRGTATDAGEDRARPGGQLTGMTAIAVMLMMIAAAG